MQVPPVADMISTRDGGGIMTLGAFTRRWSVVHSVCDVLVSDLHLWDRLTRDKARAKPGLWSSTINAVEQSAPRLVGAGPTITLCLNWANPTIRHLAATDPLVADRIVRVLYCQAGVSAHRPVRDAECSLLIASMDDLLTLASVHNAPCAQAATQGFDQAIGVCEWLIAV